jgi:hypothetical protein
VFDFQLLIHRSNHGSTVVVCLDPDISDSVFQRTYVYYNDCCKKGFLAGCRKVTGLDACCFKGASNSEVLCALGRDAFHVYWFVGLLQKDLMNLAPNCEGWVVISDEQKLSILH